MTDRIIPLPDGRFSVSREDLETLGKAAWWRWATLHGGQRSQSSKYGELDDAIDAALNKDTTDETA